MNKFIVLTLILLLFIPVNVAYADKIQTNDTWQYTANNTTYNETTVDIIQYSKGGWDYVAIARIDTDRPYSLPDLENTNLSLQNDGLLYVTQEGGITLFGNHTVTGTIHNYTVNEVPEVIITDNPAEAISTAETVTYTISYNFPILSNEVGLPAGEYVYIQQNLVISTNNVLSDQIRNYTITILNEKLYNFDHVNTSLTLSQSTKEAYQIEWDAQYKSPSYIGQSEPAKIDGLTLSQSQSFVEYFLVQDEVFNPQTDNNTAYFPLAFMGVLIIIGILNRKYTLHEILD